MSGSSLDGYRWSMMNDRVATRGLTPLPTATNRQVHVDRRGEIPAMPPARPRSALFTTVEAAEFLRYRTASGIRTAVVRGLLVPFGSGPRGTHLFTEHELMRFVRSARHADPRLETRGDKDDVDAPATKEDSAPRRVPSERQQVKRRPMLPRLAAAGVSFRSSTGTGGAVCDDLHTLAGGHQTRERFGAADRMRRDPP